MKSTCENGKYSTKIVEKLGTERSLREKYPDQDPYEWAKAYAAQLTPKEKAGQMAIIARFSSARCIPSGVPVHYKGGYLFLQAIYYELGFAQIARELSKRYSFEYDLNAILSRLLYTRILDPSSKRSSVEASGHYLEAPGFDVHQVCRALEVLAKENEWIQSMVYKNSRKACSRNSKILFYDCTHYFFEIEAEDGLKQYGVSKENRPHPIIQMGLFPDGDGMPLAFSLFPGAMNDKPGRAFVVTQSLKKMKPYLKAWALDPKGWHLQGSKKTFDLRQMDEKDPQEKKRVYYKSRWIHENDLEQQLIVTFSLKYKCYLREVRERPINRAKRKIAQPSSLKQKKANDPQRYIKSYACTEAGELAGEAVFILDTEAIKMDFYKLKGEGYVPLYTRDELTEALHEQFGFHTDHKMVTLSAMRKIISQTKKQGHMTHLLF